MRPPELLVPASSLEVLKIAVVFGADAVYIGGEAFGLRAKAKNFSMEDMKEGILFAHEHGVRVYVTANILAHNEDLEGVRAYFEELKEIGPDALIISDPGVFTVARTHQYTGEQYQLRHIFILAEAWRKPCCDCAGTFAGRNPSDPGEDTGRS